MELGEKLRRARLEAGMSQRQLCGEAITRNMLSQIENGSAKPSMRTLSLLAERLGKPVSFFLEEQAMVSPNQAAMLQARERFDSGDYKNCIAALESYQQPDVIFDRERELLRILAHLSLAEEAANQGKVPYALALLEETEGKICYCGQWVEKRRCLLRARLTGESVGEKLPGLDEELFIRSAEALRRDQLDRAAQLLDAAEDQTASGWNLLRGKIWARQGRWEEAAACFHRAEAEYPAETAGQLEVCYRELGDFKKAYEYACKQKK